METKTRIFYLEDEHYLGRIVKESLASRGYEMRLVTDGANAIRIYDQFKPDICVLDIMVPNVDGFEISKLIKEKDPKMPIIFLSAKNQTEDVIEGFKSGGNDYIKKPFSMEELILRVENLLQFQSKAKKVNLRESIKIGKYDFIYDRFQLNFGSDSISLSHRENELIHMLCEHINQKIDRRIILNKLWGDDSLYNSRNLDVYIRKLRVYFEKDENIHIKTLRGVGYHFVVG